MMSAEFDSTGVAAPDPTRAAAVSLHLTINDVRGRGAHRRDRDIDVALPR